MKVTILIFGFLFAIQVTCSSQVHPSERQIREYQEIRGMYPSDLISGFPNKIDDKKVVFTSFRFPRGKYLNYIQIALSLSNDETKSLEMELEAQAKGIYHLTDSCLITIPFDYENFSVINSDSLKNCKSSNMLPIPNVRRWGFDFTNEFYKDVTFYVLDAQKGSFLEDDNLSRSGVGLPKEWLHGYTKGVAIFKNFAIYWLEVW